VPALVEPPAPGSFRAYPEAAPAGCSGLVDPSLSAVRADLEIGWTQTLFLRKQRDYSIDGESGSNPDRAAIAHGLFEIGGGAPESTLVSTSKVIHPKGGAAGHDLPLALLCLSGTVFDSMLSPSCHVDFILS